MEAYASIGKERVSILLSNIVQTKMSLAVGFASRASIYDAVLTVYELSTAQCIVLALLHGLVNNDVAICSLLGTVSFNVQHLRSSYLKVWLKEDFQFDSEEVYRAFSTAAHYINAGYINVPKHVLQILASIVGVYGVVELCKEQGDKDTLALLESLGVDVGNKSSSEDDSPAATAEVFREEENIQEGHDDVEEEDVAHQEPSTSGQVESSGNAANSDEHFLPLIESEEFVPPFQEYSDEEDVDINEDDVYVDEDDMDLPEDDVDFVEDDVDFEDDYDDSDLDDYSYDETSDSDSNVDSTSEDEQSLAMLGLSCVLTLAQGSVDSRIIENAVNVVDENGKTLLHKAAEHGSVMAVKVLLRQGVEVDSLDKWRRTPAHLAAIGGKLQALRALYHHGGTDIMAKDNRGDTMLHSAANHGHFEVVRWLLRHDMDVEEAGRGGWRPLHRASQQGQLETVRLLLDNGACPNMMADVGGTALHRAACWDKLEVAHLLIARGAHIDTPDNRSDTPLHLAAKLGHLEMVRLLLDCGANPAVEDRVNLTPHDWAERNRHTELAEYMMSRGAAY